MHAIVTHTPSLVKELLTHAFLELTNRIRFFSYTDWQMWTAALVSDNTVRDTLITSVLKYASDGLNARPLPDLYDTVNGTALSTQARPVVGGHLALVRRA